MKLRLALVHSFYLAQNPSGENTVVAEQVELLRNAGVEVHLIAQQTSTGEPGAAALAAAGWRTATGYGRSPEKFLEALDPDVVHIHNLHPNWSAAWISRYSNITVATLHNYRPLCSAATLSLRGGECYACPTQGVIHALRNRCYHDSALATVPLAIASRKAGSKHPMMRNLQYAITLNAHSAALYRRYYPSLEVHEIPNTVSLPPKQSSLDTREPVWIYAGRLTTEKGLIKLLSIWPPDQRLDIYGEGPQAEEVIEISKRVPRIRYQGHVDRQTLRCVLESSTGLVVPSIWTEGIPTVALEAIAAGTPVLASNKCLGMQTLIESGGGNWFDFEAGSDILANAIYGLSNKQSRIEALNAYENTFGQDIWVKKILTLYNRVIANQDSRDCSSKTRGNPR